MGDRLPELDAFRGIAAISVLLYHYCHNYDGYFGYPNRFNSLLNFHFGYFGVDLFFTISGFVIFMTVERCTDSLDFVVARYLVVHWIA